MTRYLNDPAQFLLHDCVVETRDLASLRAFVPTSLVAFVVSDYLV